MKTLITPNSQKLFAAIKSYGGEVRFIGGCVRDFLCGKEINDIDLATNLKPDQTATALKAFGMTVIPTGIDHGTITAIIDDEKFEITTLRVDKETDGRHAIVEFTTDWQKDASRRDLTINQMSMDDNGKVYDYFDGIKDLKDGRVRFIGNAEDRINEDVLRILRFVRFCQRYGKKSLSAESADALACAKLAHNLSKISAERICAEFSKILVHDNALETVRFMHDLGVLAHCNSFLTKTGSFYALENMVQFERELTEIVPTIKPNFIRRLATLLPMNFAINKIDAFADYWKLSNLEKLQLQHMFSERLKLEWNEFNHYRIQVCCYMFGPQNVLDFALFRAARYNLDWSNQYDTIVAYRPIKLPISGQDLLDIGFKQGKALGDALKIVEGFWIDNRMQSSKEECLDRAKVFMRDISNG